MYDVLKADSLNDFLKKSMRQIHGGQIYYYSLAIKAEWKLQVQSWNTLKYKVLQMNGKE